MTQENEWFLDLRACTVSVEDEDEFSTYVRNAATGELVWKEGDGDPIFCILHYVKEHVTTERERSIVDMMMAEWQLTPPNSYLIPHDDIFMQIQVIDNALTYFAIGC